jgi:predicted transcriptional regulator of viral defense system
MSQVGPVVLRDVAPRAPIFTTATAAAASHVSPDTASRGLARLEEQGLVTRLVRGLWAATRHPDFSPYAVVPFLLARSMSKDEQPRVGYVSFLSALHLHGILSQIPPAIQVAVAEQHEPVHTPVGDFEFHQIQPDLLEGYKPGDAYGRFELATPAKALFDTLYLSARRGRRFSHLPELAIRGAISDTEMQRWIARIEHPSFRTAVNERWAAVRRRAHRPAARKPRR